VQGKTSYPPGGTTREPTEKIKTVRGQKKRDRETPPQRRGADVKKGGNIKGRV